MHSSVLAHDEMFVFNSLHMNTHNLTTNKCNKFCEKLKLKRSV